MVLAFVVEDHVDFFGARATDVRTYDLKTLRNDSHNTSAKCDRSGERIKRIAKIPKSAHDAEKKESILKGRHS